MTLADIYKYSKSDFKVAVIPAAPQSARACWQQCSSCRRNARATPTLLSPWVLLLSLASTSAAAEHAGYVQVLHEVLTAGAYPARLRIPLAHMREMTRRCANHKLSPNMPLVSGRATTALAHIVAKPPQQQALWVRVAHNIVSAQLSWWAVAHGVLEHDIRSAGQPAY